MDELTSANISHGRANCTTEVNEFFVTCEYPHMRLKKRHNGRLEFWKELLIIVAAILCLQSCGTTERFMQFDWKSTKAEVLDSVRAWGFLHNAAKDRWEGGTLNGYRCSKLRVWFNERDLLQGVQARYDGIDSATSRAIFYRYLEQLTRAHGPADNIDRTDEGIAQERCSWIFSRPGDEMRDMTTITRFIDYVLFHAARNNPEPFNYLPVPLAPREE